MFDWLQDTIIKWIKEEWVEQIQRQHVEKDNAANYIRRYLAGLDSFTEGMTETHVKKFLRITPTGKIAGQKFALAFHPDRLLPFGELNGATLDLVRTVKIIHELLVNASLNLIVEPSSDYIIHKNSFIIQYSWMNAVSNLLVQSIYTYIIRKCSWCSNKCLFKYLNLIKI